jgi:alkylation response protein AidB-like acyl-CoA dehydrogenase
LVLSAADGSDVRLGIENDYVLNGSKTFIPHGQLGDLFIVAAKTDPQARPPHAGISFILVEATAPGFRRRRRLDKIGLRGQDTSEIFFEDRRGANLQHVFTCGAGRMSEADAALTAMAAWVRPQLGLT